ncbi:hypothetical protein [Antarctobacter heliothermus]|uniref:Uncharacterized protein n=1 Tax=Antarctobacter heliothermus TaxID=74033 RepID=A0A239C1Z8_9RHOB|nr:hypothetical protein [Antarctobacter heliothermus]SNS13949.1 hypothetical protein SAMN04488078_100562 [Antarctobacter heliothermus]
MPVTFKVLPEANLVLSWFRGDVSTAQHIAAFQAYTADPLFDGMQHVLIDMSDCTLESSYFDDMLRLAYQMKNYYTVRDLSSKTSVYAPGDVAYGMSRMYQSITEGNSPWAFGVFRTRKEAMGFADIQTGSAQEAHVTAIWEG